jgi:DNA primase
MWAEYGIVYWPSKRRVVFPVIMDGEVYGYQARTVLAGVQPKILTSTGLKRERVLMFADRIQEGGHAVLCEGPVDAVKCSQMGGNVATMGKHVSDGQIDILRKKKVRRVYLALDPDAAEEMQILVKKLKPDFEVYQIQVPAPYKDLGEMSVEAAYECFLNAQVCNPAHSAFKLKTPKMWG